MLENLLAVLGALLVAVILASLFEYVVHVLMHRRILLGKVHTKHHHDGYGQGFLLEFLAYYLGSLPLLAAICGGAWYLEWYWIAWSLFAGGSLYAVFAAYAHQVQHDRPEVVFWMKQPVHHVHHAQQMWKKNFGIAVDWWDKVFGTYEPADWQPSPWKWSDLVRIKWI